MDRCGECSCYRSEVEPDGSRNGMGFCSSLATKQVGGEFVSPVGMVSFIAPACSHYLPHGEDARVDEILAAPRIPAGIELERAIEVQAGRCHRQQETMASSSSEGRVPLNSDQRAMCRTQLRSALSNSQFHGKIVLRFENNELFAWSVKLYPKGGEIRL